MKTILCFGDSNTWGYAPENGERYAHDVRWTGALRAELGAGYAVIEEGLNSRTTIWDDPIQAHRNGKVYLAPCLESHQPLDLVTIMLGTNDLKHRFGLAAWDIAEAAGELVDLALRSKAGPGGGAPAILLMAPPLVGKLTELAAMFEGAEAKSRYFGAYYRQIATWNGCGFLDTSEVISCSDLDGIHFEAAEHRKLGLAVAAAVREMLA
jgi:lysophospholipase L1-like esterase